jgi:hypothetical protein
MKMLRSGKHPVIPGLAKPQAEALKVEFEALRLLGHHDTAGSSRARYLATTRVAVEEQLERVD